MTVPHFSLLPCAPAACLVLNRKGRVELFFFFLLFCFLVDVADALDREGRDEQQTQLACRGKQPPPPYNSPCLSFTPVFLSRRLSILFFFFFCSSSHSLFLPIFLSYCLSCHVMFSLPLCLDLSPLLSLSFSFSLFPFLPSSLSPSLPSWSPHPLCCGVPLTLISASFSLFPSLSGLLSLVTALGFAVWEAAS